MPCRRLALLLCLFITCVAARADVTLLVEEPINFIGRFTVSGHVALLLDTLCSEDHLHIHPCSPGQPGTVIGRYNGIGPHDWLAMDPAPYLYAAEDDNHLPASITAARVTALREQYRVDHLEAFAPDPRDQHWIQLAGAAYRRRIYCITLRTTPTQELRLTQWLNLRSNRSHFNLLFNNCADFVRQALNVLYPGAIHRSFFFDLGITTPKQVAAQLHGHARRHPELDFRLQVIPQVPGDLPRSGRSRGVTEAFAKTKPYFFPVAYVVPITTGAVIAAGLADHRFDIHSAARTAPELDLDPHSDPLGELPGSPALQPGSSPAASTVPTHP